MNNYKLNQMPLLQTFKEYPPSQVGGSLSIEKALQMVERGASGGGK